MLDLREPKEIIRQRRHQMLIHSYLYYVKDSPRITDEKWQQWADELTDLQNKNPDETKLDFYDEVFAEWNGSTGMHLPFDPWLVNKAKKLYNI
jgi:NAD-dependent DNA ligase